MRCISMSKVGAFLQCLTSYKTSHKFIYLSSHAYRCAKFATFFEVITHTPLRKSDLQCMNNRYNAVPQF